jgi:hypothetical protein
VFIREAVFISHCPKGRGATDSLSYIVEDEFLLAMQTANDFSLDERRYLENQITELEKKLADLDKRKLEWRDTVGHNMLRPSNPLADSTLE